jgi:CubicO group peptidase (beta-lactamase class C family)
MRIAIFLIVLQGVLSGTPSQCQQRALIKVEKYVDSVWRASKAPGFSVAVSKNGKEIFSASKGLIDVENQVQTSKNSVFNIGSVSKLITAVTIMQLVEMGKINLDDFVSKYVSCPDDKRNITIRHLLTHSSGIRHYSADDFPAGLNNENTKPFASYEQCATILGLIFK